MRLGIRGEMRALLLAVGGVAVACSGRVAGIGDDGGLSSSSSGSGSSGGSSSGVVSGSTGGGNSGSTGGSTSSGGSSGSTSSGGTGSNGGSTSGGGTGSSGGSSSGGGVGSSSGGPDLCSAPGVCNEPPAAPSGPPTSISAAHDYAIRTLFLGDTDRSGVSTPTAWRSFGYDLDGKLTIAQSTDVCILPAGAAKVVQIDGNGGIDNSWGANIVPIMETLNSTFSQSVNASIQAGGPTQLFYVVGFDDSAGNMTTAAGLSGLTLATAPFSTNGGNGPTWNTSTHWPIAPEYMTGCTLSGGCAAGTDPLQAAQIRFPAAFQVGGTFATGTPVDIALQIALGGQPMILTLHQAVVTFAPSSPGAVTNGTIAGVLNTQEFIAQLQLVAGRISTSLCSGSAFQSIATQIQQTSDIVLNGSTVSNPPGVMCNAISIGLGFDATEVAVPVPADIAGPQPTPPNPCGDGG